MNAIKRARTIAVRAALDQVTDPELDESVVKLGFVTAVDISDDSDVRVEFRLPTYWCAANFSYLMAADMRDAVAALAWVRHVEVHLDEHMFIDAINKGIAAGHDFTDAFPSESGKNLDELRQHFGLKSFERRQDSLIRYLLAQGYDQPTLVGLSLTGLNRLTLEPEGAELRARYIARRALVDGGDLAFVTTSGDRIMHETLMVYLRHIHRIGLNAEFNAALCSGLLAARYNETKEKAAAEPELIDFIRKVQQEAPNAV